MSKHLEKEKRKLIECAWAHYHLGMSGEECDDCLKLIAIDPADPNGYLQLGSAYENQGAMDKAKICYLELVNRFPSYSAGYVNLGYFFEKHEKRLDLATVCYEKAAELDPACELALNNVATMFQKNGQWFQARVYFEQANAIVESKGNWSCFILHNLAWACYHCGDYDEASRLYKKLLNLCPEDYKEIHSILADFGCVCYKMGLLEDAVRLFDDALSIVPANRRCRRLYKIASKKFDNQDR